MNERWYADARDVVKWATLLHLAEEHQLKTILQVAFFTIPDKPLNIGCGSASFVVQAKVWKHFRNPHDILRLGKNAGVRIEIFDGRFRHGDRDQYLANARRRIGELYGPKIAFLDPDTGLAEQASDAKHITIDETGKLWKALDAGDWLVLYQHRWRETGWEEVALKRFCRAVRNDHVEMFQSEKVGRDVILLATRRPVE